METEVVVPQMLACKTYQPDNPEWQCCVPCLCWIDINHLIRIPEKTSCRYGGVKSGSDENKAPLTPHVSPRSPTSLGMVSISHSRNLGIQLRREGASSRSSRKKRASVRSTVSMGRTSCPLAR